VPLGAHDCDVVTGAAGLDSAGAVVELDSLAVLDSLDELVLDELVPEELVVSRELAAGVLFVVVETAGALVVELLVLVERAGS
jgi:hypothetical protein